MMLVGEQPGDQEDEAGKPFIGPAGRLLDKALAIESDFAEAVTATIHPSAILRGEPGLREAEFAAFVDDLRFVVSLS